MKKNKFPKEAWLKIKSHCDNWHAECHHCMGKQYEYLSTLKLMSSHDHRHNHKKYIHNMPEEEKQKNLAQWRVILGEEDYNYFVERGLDDAF